MKRFSWFAAALFAVAGLSAGCSNRPASSAPPATSKSGPPKDVDDKSKVKGGIENPPPP